MLILFIFSFNESYSQQRLTTEEERKLAEIEEESQSEIKDTTKFVMDTVGLRKPMPNHTKIILGEYAPFRSISKKEILFKSFYTFHEIIKSENIGYPLSLGFPGMNNSFSIAGSLLSGNNIRLAGNNMNDFETGVANLSLIPVESFETAEIFIGSDAVIFGSNSTGTLLNIQEVIHNTYIPFTKLWYSQGSDELIVADGSFSQNFAKNFNLDLGFRSMNSPGRFINQKLNTWNLRARVRWTPTELTNISLSEHYTNYGIGENGGISPDKSSDIFDDISALPLLFSSNSRLFRHNLNLNISTYLDSSKHFGIISNTGFVHSDKHFRDGDFIISAPKDSLKNLDYLNYTLSNRTQIETFYGPVAIIAGEEVSFNKFISNRYFGDNSYFNFALFGLGKIRIMKKIELTGGGRYFNHFGKNGLSVGAKIKLNIDSNRTFFADISKSDRLPSLFEGINLNAEHHYLIMSGLEWNLNTTKLELLGFLRQVDLPIHLKYYFDTTSQSYLINHSNGSNMRILGLEGKSSFKISSKLFTDLFIKTYISQLNSQNKNVFPQIYSGVKSFYMVTAGRSELHLGLDYEFIIGGGGMSYFPVFNSNYYVDSKSTFTGNGINLWIEGKLGEAYLKASLNNLLDQGYYFVPYYPELGRHFNFTFTWTFFN